MPSFFLNFKLRRIFLRHSHLCITSTKAAYTATNVHLTPRHLVFQKRQVILWHSHEQVPSYHFHKLPRPTMRHLVLTNPHFSTAVIYYPYLRRHPTSTPSCFSISYRIWSSSGTLFTPMSLPTNHFNYHFPTTSGVPQALPISHLDNSAPYNFSLPNHVRSFSGNPTFEVHEVSSTQPYHWVTAAGGVTST